MSTIAAMSSPSVPSTQRENATRKIVRPNSAPSFAVGFRRAALAQGVGHRRRETCELQQLALLQAGVRVDDGLALPGEGAALVGEEGGRDGSSGPGDHRERLGVRRRGTMLVDEHPLEHVLAGEEHLALVGEVAEEGPLGEARPARDLGDRGRVEPALGEELKGGGLQALARTGLPAGHGVQRSDDRD